MAGKGSKPGERRGGRSKGTPNKITRNIREAIENAFSQVGGEAYLKRVAKTDPRTFCGLVAKCVPTQITGGDGPPIRAEVRTAQHEIAVQAVKELGERIRQLGSEPIGADDSAHRHAIIKD